MFALKGHHIPHTGVTMGKFVDAVLQLDRSLKPSDLARKIYGIIVHYHREELNFSVYLLLSKLEVLSAFLVALWLRKTGSNSAGVALALAIGGHVHGDSQEEWRGLSELPSAVDALTPAQQEEFYRGVVHPVMTHLLQNMFSDHARLIRLVDILKASAPHLRRRVVYAVFLEVSSACHFDCANCAHGEMRAATKKYQMTLEQLKKFIYFTEKSNYYIEHLRVHGPGEPLLWRHFNEGMFLLRQSKSIGRIEITTNGMAIHKIEEATWDYVDSVDVSVYEEAQPAALQDALSKHPDKVRLNQTDDFIRRVSKEEVPIAIPCWCGVSGPMVYGDVVFLSCGPTVFGAADLIGKDAFSMKDLYVDLSENYLETFDAKKIGNMELCRYCWGNNRRAVEKVKHHTSGGGWQ
ncbi:MAG: radical SAM protein [Magnetococcus sp. XQGC-1]